MIDSKGRDRALIPLLALVVLAGAALRVSVWRSLPDLFGPGDPAIYLQMARGVATHGVPRVDFLHHFLTTPQAIAHVEDYYEPAFAWLLSPAYLLGHGSPVAVAVVPLCLGILSVVLVAWLSRRHGAAVAVVAATIVAFEPWSIYYSGVLMKESAVTVFTLAFLELLRRQIGGTGRPFQAGLVVGCAAVVAGLVQYESIPILMTTALLVLAFHRRQALPGFLLGAGVSLLILVAATWPTLGVPISAKYLFAAGRDMATPDAMGRATSLARFLPLGYALGAILTAWYPLMGVLALAGAGDRAVPHPERTAWAAFALAHLWLHGIPADLWCRDFIPLTAVLATPVAIALTRRHAWQERHWPLAVLGAGLGFLYASPALIAWLIPHAPWLRSGGTPIRIAFGALAALVVFGLPAAMASQRWRAALSVVAPVLAAIGLVWSAWTLLPWTRLWSNPQFPNYEVERARRERVDSWIRGTLEPGPVIGREPAEIELYSGMPAVALPYPPLSPTLNRIARQWHARWLVVEPGDMPDSALARLPVRLVGEREGVKVFGF